MEDILYYMDTPLCPGARNEASLRLMCQCYELLGSTPSPALFFLGLGMGLGAVLWYGRAGTDWLAHLCNGLRTYLPPQKQGLACLWNTCECPRVPRLCSRTAELDSGIRAARTVLPWKEDRLESLWALDHTTTSPEAGLSCA